MSYGLDAESLETLTFERSKIWSNFLKSCEEIKNGDEIDVSLFESLFDDPGTEEQDEESMMEFEEAEEDDVEDDINTTQHMTKAQLTQMLTTGTNKEILDQTMPIVEEHRRKWKEAGLDRILNTFDAHQIEEHVGGWMRRNNSCYIGPSPKASALSEYYKHHELVESEEEEEETEQTVRYMHNSCKRSASKKCQKSPRTALKMYRTLPPMRNERRAQYAAWQLSEEQEQRKHMRSMIQQSKERHRRQRERELIFHTSPRHYSCSMVHKMRKHRDYSRLLPASSSSEEERENSLCECESCNSTTVAHSYYSSYRNNYHSRSMRDPYLRDHHHRHEQRYALESRSFSNNVYCKRSMRHQMQRQHAFDHDRRPRLVENKCGCCNSGRLCSKVVHLANSSTEEWVVENKSSPDAYPFETPKQSSSRGKTPLKMSTTRSKAPAKTKIKSIDEELLFEPPKVNFGSNVKTNIRAKMKSIDEERLIEPPKAAFFNNFMAPIKSKSKAVEEDMIFETPRTTVGNSSKAPIKARSKDKELADEFLFEPPKEKLGNKSRAPIKSKNRAVEEDMLLETPKATIGNNTKAAIKAKSKDKELADEFLFEQPKEKLAKQSKAPIKSKSKAIDEDMLLETPAATVGNSSKAPIKAKSKDEELADEFLFEPPKEKLGYKSRAPIKSKNRAVEEDMLLETPAATVGNSSKAPIKGNSKDKELAEELLFKTPTASCGNNSKAQPNQTNMNDIEEVLFKQPIPVTSNTKSKPKATVSFSNDVESVPSTSKASTKSKAQKSSKKEQQLPTNDAQHSVASPPKSTRKPRAPKTSTKEQPHSSAPNETMKQDNELPPTPEKPIRATRAAKAPRQKKPATKTAKKVAKSKKNQEEIDEDELDEEFKRALVLSEQTYVEEQKKSKSQAANETESPQLPEQSMFNNQSVACNSTALSNDTACGRTLKPQKKRVNSNVCIDLCSPDSSRNDIPADTDCTMVTSTTTGCDETVAAAAKRPQLKISKKGVLLYEPQNTVENSRSESIISNKSTANFTLSEHTLSPIIGKQKARKFFKYYTGSCSFDSRCYVYYCPPDKLLNALKTDSKSLDLDSSGSSSCDDDLEILAGLGVIYTEIDKGNGDD